MNNKPQKEETKPKQVNLGHISLMLGTLWGKSETKKKPKVR